MGEDGPVDELTAERERIARELAQARTDREERTKRRGRQTIRDMVLSMLVVAALAIVIAQPWRQDSVQIETPTVDWSPVATAYAGTVHWPVLAPAASPQGWRATTVRISPEVDGRTTLHVGWMTAGQQYAALEVTDTADTRWLDSITLDGRPTGTPYIVNGRSWTRLENPQRTERSLVLTATVDGRTTTHVVTGSADWAELESLAGALVVRAPAPSPSAG